MHLKHHVRKRKEPYPSRHFWVRLLDIMVYTGGIVGPLFTIPQIWQIYSTHSAGDIAPLSWLMWTLFDIPWIIYGFVHREPPIIITYSLWAAFNLLVFIGALLYA